jgi:formylglycine-generating enzyme required for sulfatase activity
MATHKRRGWWTLAIGLTLCTWTVPVWAVDSDGDGVDDAIDVCNNTPPEIVVDAEGRPIGDVDLDCDVDLDDFAELAANLTGPIAPLGACCQGDGSCALAPEAYCPGVWQGADTSCDPNPCIAPNTLLVPAGPFDMGDPWGEGDNHELPVHAVLVDGYWIDAFEVTNQQYADALNWAWGDGNMIEVTETGIVRKLYDTEEYCDTVSSSVYSRIAWDGAAFGVVAGAEDHPVVMVSWYGAVAYCNWRSAMVGRTPCYDLGAWECDYQADGFRLPTEAEWEKAAGWAPDEQRHYRFGEHSDGCGYDCLDGERVNYLDSGDPYDAAAFPRTTPVGFYDGSLHLKIDFGWPSEVQSYQTQDAQSFYGCRDMSGNAWEWCHDWYDNSYYEVSPYYNPTGPATGLYRVVRGGRWSQDPSACRSAARYRYPPETRNVTIGFRSVVGTP